MRSKTIAALIGAAALWLAGQSVAVADDMTFRLVPIGDAAQCGSDCPRVIAAEGEIVDGTPGAFVEFLKKNIGDSSLRSVLMFNSPGGKVTASLKFGIILRRLGIATVVARARAEGAGFTAGRCYSACVYALMGGKKRVVPDQSEVGIHRSFIARYGDEPKGYNPDNAPKVDADLSLALIARYSDEMGVSRGLAEQAQRTSPNSIHIVTRQEMLRWRLAGSKL